MRYSQKAMWLNPLGSDTCQSQRLCHIIQNPLQLAGLVRFGRGAKFNNQGPEFLLCKNWAQKSRKDFSGDKGTKCPYARESDNKEG